MGANSSSSGSKKRSSSEDGQLKAYKTQYEGAKKRLAMEREKLARLRASNNSKSAIEYQKAAVESAKDYVARTKNLYDGYRKRCK